MQYWKIVVSDSRLKVNLNSCPTEIHPSLKRNELRRSMCSVDSRCWEFSWLTFSRLDWLTQNTWIPVRWADCMERPIGLGGLPTCFFDSKFMAIFSLLFGAGTVLIWQRSSRAGRKSTWLHYRRMFWLLLFGLAHAHLLWFGEILFLYSVCGMTVYWLWGLSPRWLIPLGLSFIAVASGISL